MWIDLSKEQLQLIHASLGALTIQEALQIRSMIESTINASDGRDDAWREKAKELYQVDGEVEIDPGAVVSHSNHGAYVGAWVWVENSDMGIEDDEKEDPDGAEE